MATFGKTSVGATLSVLFPAADVNSTCQFQLTEKGRVSKLTVYFTDGTNATHASGACRGVIYNTSYNVAGQLLGATDELNQTDDNVDAWEDLTFATPVDLPAGWYCLGVHSAVQKFGASDAAGLNPIMTDTYSDGPASTHVPNNSMSVNQKSIYATYEPFVGRFGLAAAKSTAIRSVSSNRSVISTARGVLI